jgi:hypothetical protein
MLAFNVFSLPVITSFLGVIGFEYLPKCRLLRTASRLRIFTCDTTGRAPEHSVYLFLLCRVRQQHWQEEAEFCSFPLVIPSFVIMFTFKVKKVLVVKEKVHYTSFVQV